VKQLSKQLTAEREKFRKFRHNCPHDAFTEEWSAAVAGQPRTIEKAAILNDIIARWAETNASRRNRECLHQERSARTADARHRLALELVCGVTFSWEWMCGAGPGDLRRPRGVVLAGNSGPPALYQ